MSNQSNSLVAENLAVEKLAPRVLLVDDDLYFREFLRRLLVTKGYEVLEARSAQEAETQLRHRPDLAIIDYRLPNMDGSAYIESLRERGVTFPIVFCSGSTYSQQTHANVRNLLKVDLILRKPVQAQEFLEHMQSLLPISVEAIGSQSGPISLQPVHLESVDQDAFEATDHAIGKFCFDTSPPLDDVPAALLQSAPVYNQSAFIADQPTLSSDQSALTSDQSALTSDQSALTSNQAALTSNQAALTSNQAALSSEQASYLAVEEEESIQEAMRQLASEYLNELPEMVRPLRERLTEGLANSDFNALEAVSDVVHKIRGTGGSLGLSNISAIAGNIEDLLDSFVYAGLTVEHSRLFDLLGALEMALICAQLRRGSPCTTSMDVK
jgi:DNA-binding response OmpR family regulator